MALDPKAQRLQALVAYQLLKAKAVAVLGTAYVNKGVLAVLAKAAAISAKTSYQSLDVAVHASLLQAVTQTGKFFLLLKLLDNVQLIETQTISISRVSRDEFRLIDQAFISLSKTILNPVTVTEVSLHNIGKAVQDQEVLTSELLLKILSKGFSDSPLVTDLYSNGVGKNFNDPFAVGDLKNILFDKAVEENKTAIDTLSRVVSYVREFVDSANPSDAVNVSAITDDGEVMLFGKSNLDSIFTSDSRQYDLLKLLTDSGVTSELTTYSITKVRTDASTTSDILAKGFYKPFDDSNFAADSKDFSLSRLVSETQTTSDSQVRNFQKSIADIVTTSDALGRALSLTKYDVASPDDLPFVVFTPATAIPIQYDSTSISEVIQRLFTKTFTESSYLADIQTTQFGKNVTESLSAADQRSVSMQRSNSEPLTANDSGVLFWTNYCDSSYFSQSYVGNERTFT